MNRKKLWLLYPVLTMLLAFCLAVPVNAVVPLPHNFYGSLTIDMEPALAGRLVEARGEGVMTTAANPITTTDVGEYGGPGPLDPKLEVQGDIEEGTPIEFYVDEVRAQCREHGTEAWLDSYPWHTGGKTELDLRVGEVPPEQYTLTVTSTAGGSVTTPGEGTFPDYPAGTAVDLVAVPDAGYEFLNWTGDVGTVADVNAASTTITMNGNYSITANFALIGVTEPVASFTADPTSGDKPLEVSFTDTSTSYDGIISWAWDFSYVEGLGFNVESTDQNPIYTYQSEGIHSVALRVTEADDDSDMMVAEDLITVTPPTPPTVVSTSPSDTATNVAVDATVSATFDEDIEEGANFGDIAISGATGVSASIDGATLTIAHADFDYETSYTVTIPAEAVNDLDGNPLAEAEVWSFTTRGEVPPPIATITLPAGWNLLSTPIKLDADSAVLEQIFDAESQANIEASWRWDIDDQEWKVPTDYELSPLEAVYLKVSSNASATAELRPCQERSEPPWRELQPGLNLIGPAPALGDVGFPAKPLDQALISIEEAEGGLRGYTMVVSPPHNQPPWDYDLGGEIRDLLPFNGYWVVMENADTLYGSSTTPIP